MSVFKKVYCLSPYVKKYFGHFILGIIGLLMSTGSVVFFGRVIGEYVDADLNLDFIHIKSISALLICFVLGSFIRSYIFNYYSRKVVWDITKDAYNKTLHSSQDLFDEKGNTKIVSEFSSSISFLIASVGNCVSFVIRYSISLLGGIVMMFISNIQLSFFALIVVPVFAVVLLPLRRRSKRLNKNLDKSIGNIKLYISESILGVKNIQAYVKEKDVFERFCNILNDMLEQDRKRLLLKSFSIVIVFVSFFAFIIGFVAIGKFYVNAGAASIGDVISFIFYCILSAVSVVGIMEVLSNANGIFESLETLLSFRNLSSTKSTDTMLQLPKDTKDLKIEFKNFSLSLKNREILKKINFSFFSRKKIAIVGPSGSGKTSICNALLRFVDASSGEINFSENIKSFNLYEFRRLFSFTSNEYFIFEGSFASNISYGASDIATDDIRLAAELAEAKDFIMSFDNGFEEKITYGAKKISEGQRQRLMIARCLFFKRPIIVFDEATSALDFFTEKKILHNIFTKCNWDFFIAVTHRVSVVKDFDLIIVMKGGSVESYGTHDELLEKSNVYKDLISEDCD